MRCTTYRHGDVTAVVCSSGRTRVCASCGAAATQECDHPVKRPNPARPKRGDARVHREFQRVFYVHDVSPGLVTISTSERGSTRSPKTTTVTTENWFKKTSAMCNRPICKRCAVKSGELELCPPHARAKEQ
ncbi:MAG TPA: hypothetical protein VHO25_22230, partial [Polyangiaceae bacterium]|nr:hypothetical protein [Polyangiaceae bacterium]